MKSDRPSLDSAISARASTAAPGSSARSDRHSLDVAVPRGLLQAWSRFWFTPVEASQLHRLRVFAGVLFLFWILALAGTYHDFLSLQGWFDRGAYLELSRPEPRIDAPAPIGWSIFYLAAGSGLAFDLLYWGSVLVVALFTLGIAPRLTSILTWVVVVSLTANPATSYDADFLMVILAFYLMIGYVVMGLWTGQSSLLQRLFGPNDGSVLAWFTRRERHAVRQSYAANLAVRLFQVHFALIIVTSAVAKLQIPDWWAGVAYWYPLHSPFQTTRDSYVREQTSAALLLGFLGLIQYLVLVWQVGFPAFAWRQGRWRIVTVGGGMVGLLGCLFFFGLPLFGPFYLIGCLSYLGADEWLRIRTWFGERLGRGDAGSFRALAQPHKMKVGIK